MTSSSIDRRRFAPATERNREPILAVLRRVLPAHGTVLEIAAGTGEHAVYFAAAFPSLTWQPSDGDSDAAVSIAAWREADGTSNLNAPLLLDAAGSDWPVGTVDAIFSANMIHIAPWVACLGLMAGARRHLAPGGVLVLYGPYRIGGAPTAPSNDAFDRDLRARNPAWGVRDLEEVVRAAQRERLELEETVAMPANNHILVLRRP
ncbi:MAG: DUF938 domain-containing protein [Candidatus Binatia bacterium]